MHLKHILEWKAAQMRLKILLEELLMEIVQTKSAEIYGLMLISALINIADLHPSIHCVSVGFNRIAKKPHENYLIELFQNRNIHMIEV